MLDRLAEKTSATVTVTHIYLDEHGVAWIDNTKTKVIEVVLDKLAYGSSPEEIHFQYPHLFLAQIHAVFAYCYDHQVELDREIQFCWVEVNALAAQETDSPLRKRLHMLRQRS